MNVLLPEAYQERMKAQLGEAYPVFEQAYHSLPVRGIRFHPEKTSPFLQEQQRMMEQIPWEEQGYYIRPEDGWGKTIYHEAGAFYLQEPSAMIPAAVLDPKPGEVLLDLCAAPGGKSTQIGAAMRGDGILVCNEIVPQRARILSRNIERMGIRNAVVTQEPPERLAGKWPEGFDGVLVDAPCSGEGMFRRDPETIAEWSEEKAAGCAGRQRDILEQAAALVRPGGRLVYSTCTFHPEENERMIAWFLERFPEFETEAFSVNGTTAENGYRTFYPHEIRGEGQFAALLRKRGEAAADPGEGKLLPPARHETDMLKELFSEPIPEKELHIWGKGIIRMKAVPDLDGIRVLRCGLHLAEIRDRYLIPDHALALSGTGRFKTQQLSAESALKYMAGETVQTDGSGWILACYDGIGIGWGKGGQGILKNHYPKGLRKPHLIPGNL